MGVRPPRREAYKDRLACSVQCFIVLFKKVLSLKYPSILVLSELNQRNKFVCVAMCSLVMSRCSRDVITILSMAVDEQV